MARWLASRVEEAQPAMVPGRLLAIAGATGWFPALVHGLATHRCHGTLVRVALGRGELTRLDRYEGREYRRTAVRVRCDASLVTAMVYRWHAPRPTGSLIIPGGDFLSWLGRTGRSSFTTSRIRA